MNFLSTFLRFIVIITVIVFVSYFGARELVLYFASTSVIREARFLTQPRHYQAAQQRCLAGEGAGRSVSAVQLRFLDDREYVVEVVCVGGVDQEVARGRLPWKVRKTTGSAGFWYNIAEQNFVGEVTLRLLGENKLLLAEGDKVTQRWGSSQLRSSVPASVCMAHGLQCCDAVLQVGDGAQQAQGVTDCRDQCYPVCLQRPLLLALETDPRYDYETRTATLTPNSTSVAFFYAFEEQEAPVTSVTIEYGDGESETATVAEGEFVHDYACPSGSCEYTAKIRAIDSRGLSSPDTRLTSVRIVVAAQ